MTRGGLRRWGRPAVVGTLLVALAASLPVHVRAQVRSADPALGDSLQLILARSLLDGVQDTVAVLPVSGIRGMVLSVPVVRVREGEASIVDAASPSVELSVEDGSIARLEGRFVRLLAPGRTEITGRVEGRSVTAPLVSLDFPSSGRETRTVAVEVDREWVEGEPLFVVTLGGGPQPVGPDVRVLEEADVIQLFTPDGPVLMSTVTSDVPDGVRIDLESTVVAILEAALHEEPEGACPTVSEEARRWVRDRPGLPGIVAARARELRSRGAQPFGLTGLLPLQLGIAEAIDLDRWRSELRSIEPTWRSVPCEEDLLPGVGGGPAG